MYLRYAIATLTHIPDFLVFVTYSLTAPTECDPAIFAARADTVLDTDLHKRTLWETAAPVSTTVVFPVDTVLGAPNLVTRVQASAGLTLPVLRSLSSVPAAADSAHTTHSAMYASIFSASGVKEWNC